MFLLPGNAVNRSAPLNRGLVSWWMVLPNRLGVGGNTFRDLMGRNHGTLTNGPTWSGSAPGGGFGSLSFDGSNDLVQMAAQQGQQSGFSQACWVKPTSAAANYNIGFNMYSSTSPSAAYTQFFTLSGNFYGRIHKTRDTAYIGRRTTGGVSTSWTHVVFTWNGGTTASAIAIYVNGVQADTTDDTAGSFTGPYTGSDIKPTLGVQWSDQSAVTTGSSRYNGFLADCAVWNRALSSSEAIARYRSSLTGYLSELNWQRYPVYAPEQAAATFNPAWAINSNAYIHLGA